MEAPLHMRVVISAARDTVRINQCWLSLVTELSKEWERSLLIRMGYVKLQCQLCVSVADEDGW